MWNKITSILKKYWGLFLGLSAGLIFLFYKNKKKDDTSLSSEVRSSNRQLLNDIDHIRETENDRSKNEVIRHSQSMEVIKTKYDDLKERLNDEEKAECERILKQSGKSPKQLAEEFADFTGAKIILPEE